MTPISAAGPVSLSYVTALRGFAPRRPGVAFTYALATCQDTALLTCLAASNPEGRFFGLVADQSSCAQGQLQARMQHVDNVTFIKASIEDVLKDKTLGLPPLDYLAADESKLPLSAQARIALFDVAKDLLIPGGVFHYTYKAYADEAGPLRFLVREVAPEMNVDQAKGFLKEIKLLGSSYLARNPAVVENLEAAIASNVPDEFFHGYDGGEATSGSFDTIVALRPRGFAYAGDTHVQNNYIDFSASAEAAELIIKCRDNPLYEAIKDFTLDRTVRSDIWCREPARRSAALPDLFGGFAYGIIMETTDVPASVSTRGATVDLSSLLFKKLIGLLTIMPLSVGDFLSHPDGKGFQGDDVVGALQVLVACGIAQPMRGINRPSNLSSIAQPRFSGDFNRILGHAEVSSKDALFASQVMGSAIAVPARDVLVMQALDRAGLANSVSALLPELERASKNPALAAQVSDGEPTATTAHALIENTVSRSIVQWYAYGLLEAA